ncbi:MAG: SDR family oxidoreductase [Deltaproteobacteria bacterium]|nr:SDR family oxidoreductase [Deltaproteobacteria bacterium]
MARKRALVTGAAVRLGRAFAEHLAARGYDLVLHTNTRRAQADALAKTLRKKGLRIDVVQADIARPVDVAAMFDAFPGRLDLVVNSAAMFEKAPFLELSDTQLAHMVLTNLLGPMLVCRHAAERMTRGGQIVNMLDIGALQPWRGFAHYCSAKAGLAMLTRVLALELAPKIRVNGIAPGTVLIPESYTKAQRRALAGSIPLGRVGQVEDVLRALDYLVDAEFITGTFQVVDGGRSQGEGGGSEVA